MCLICVEFQRERMTLAEARRALGEMTVKIGPEHAREVQKILRDAEQQASAPAPGAGSAPQGTP